MGREVPPCRGSAAGGMSCRDRAECSGEQPVWGLGGAGQRLLTLTSGRWVGAVAGTGPGHLPQWYRHAAGRAKVSPGGADCQDKSSHIFALCSMTVGRQEHRAAFH